MATKRIALTDTVIIDGVTFSNGEVRAISSNFEHERVPAGGFNTTGTVEELAGQTTREITATFYAGDTASGPFQILEPLFEGKLSFDITWHKSGTAPTCTGTVKIFSLPQGATFGELETFDVTFVQAPSGTTLGWSFT